MLSYNGLLKFRTFDNSRINCFAFTDFSSVRKTKLMFNTFTLKILKTHFPSVFTLILCLLFIGLAILTVIFEK